MFFGWVRAPGASILCPKIAREPNQKKVQTVFFWQGNPLSKQIWVILGGWAGWDYPLRFSEITRSGCFVLPGAKFFAPNSLEGTRAQRGEGPGRRG